MKKLTSLLIGCSLAFAGAVLAQQPDEQQQPSKGKRAPEKAHATQAQPKPNAANPQGPPATHQGALQQKQGAPQQHQGALQQHQGAPQQPGATNDAGAIKQKQHEATTGHAATNQPGAGKRAKASGRQEAETTAPKTNVSGQSADTSTQNQNPKQQRVEQRKKGMKGQAAEKTTTNPAGPAAGATGAGAASSVPAAGQQNVQANAGAKMKKPAPQQIQQVKSQRANFKAQPKPQQVQAVTFNQNHRIEGSDRWQGQQYEVFRSYRPEWHDAGWYHSHYPNVTLIAGGYYFFNQGYWYPAWGYNASSQYYAYDGPIYVGQRAQPPDQVIAQTQDLLQQMGYYTGEVDGLLGPLTREALTAYQNDNGLAATAAIDQPTLDSLGLA